MKTVKLFSQNRRTPGTTTTLPIVGVVSFSREDNSIEVNEDLIDQLRARDFGIILLTVEELEDKKKSEAEARNKTLKKPAALDFYKEMNKIPLVDVFRALQAGRSKADLLYLEDLINDLEKTSDPIEKDKDNIKMLNALNDKELSDLLSIYPEKETKKLSGREKIVEYLIGKMKQ